MNKDKLIELINAGYSTYNISEEMEKGQTTVRHWLKKFNLKTKSTIILSGDRYCKNSVCNKKLKGKQILYCSNKCYQKCVNKEHKTYFWSKKRGLKKKKELVKLLGGKCEECGYHKNLAALAFHHKNPEEKLFNINQRICSNLRTEELIKEVKKCKLLCMNCHTALHNPDYEVEN